MPTYSFICADCDAKKEIRAGYTEAYVFPWCDDCGIQMKRNYSVPGLIFKGQGFYVNDKGKR